MHESDAMDFIEPVLLYFVGRVFGEEVGEDSTQFDPLMDKIRVFIKDDSPFWVKEKALQVIRKIEEADYSIRKDEFSPKSAADCLDVILFCAKRRIKNKISEYQTKEQNGVYHIDVPPSFPEN
jgi:hypothetical protein